MESPFVSLPSSTSSPRRVKLALGVLALVGTIAVCLLATLSSTQTENQSTLIIEDPEVNTLYKEWKNLHGHKFNSYEDKIRAQIFYDTHKDIEAHNADPTNTWKKGHGPYSAITDEEFQAIYLTMGNHMENHKNDPNREVHEERITTVHQNSTHRIHHTEDHTYFNNKTRHINHEAVHTHHDGTEIVHKNNTHFNNISVPVFHHSNAFPRHSDSVHELFKHIEHNHTHRELKNDSHVIETTITHTLHYNGTQALEYYHREINNEQGTERIHANSSYVHPDGAKTYSNSVHNNIPYEDYTLLETETNILHPNGTEAIHKEKTIHYNNNTVINDVKVLHKNNFADYEVVFVLSANDTIDDGSDDDNTTNATTTNQTTVSKYSAYNVDWTDKGIVTPVRYQGGCGSCYTFAGLAAIESALAQSGAGLLNLAEQQAMDCSIGYGCNGGLILNVFKYNAKNGFTTENEYPYNSRTGSSCKIAKGPYKISSYGNVLPQGNIVATLKSLALRPLAVSVSVDGWKSYASGILPACNDIDDGLHGVLLVGVKDGVWKIKNSWGKAWGEDGYIRIAPGNGCKVASWPVWISGAKVEANSTSTDSSTNTTSTVVN